jgi:thiol-disulfide isomerase/thioredoxin
VCPTKAISWRGGKVILPPDEIAPVTSDMSDEEREMCLVNSAKSNKKLAKRRLITRIVAAVIMVSLLVSALVYYNFIDKPIDESFKIYGEGDMCPSLEIPIYNGEGEYTESFNPMDNKGKVTIINFWGVWCPGCIKELPYFDQIASDFYGEVDVIAIHTFDQMEESDEYIEENFEGSKILFGVDRLTKEGDTTSGEYLYTTLGGTGTYPITIIVDPSGEIFSLQQTELDYDTLLVLVMAAMSNAQ